MSSVGIHPPKTPVTKGSHTVAKATIPNFCKMPGPPAPFVPAPLPNIAKSELSPNGYSTTVKIEGNTVAIRGATFESIGDMASKGTGGGLISANTHGPAKFITPGSLTVKIEGKSVHLLGESMLNNCGPSGSPPNTGATMTGADHADIQKIENELDKIACDCAKDCEFIEYYPPGDEKEFLNCLILGSKRHKCVADKLRDGKPPPSETGVHPGGGANYQSNKMPDGQAFCRPDIVVTAPGTSPPIDASKMKAIIDLKFKCNKKGEGFGSHNPNKMLGKAQRECYQEIKLETKCGGTGKAKPGGVTVKAIGPTEENCS
jgi:uncharacterized Zn-binding protein involved in type VI secretion